jgi:hypothetical protein
MGFITGLLTLPLAPVRGTIWIAEQLAAEAERELRGGSARRRLLEAERQLQVGVISLEEYDAIEDEALTQLEAEQEELKSWQT